MADTAAWTDAANIPRAVIGIPKGVSAGATPEMDYSKRYIESSQGRKRRARDDISNSGHCVSRATLGVS